MCGISGVITKQGQRVEEHHLKSMMETMVHRGPDESGLWRGENAAAHVGLGHQRLSILDHQGGRQPMVSSESQLILAFNGQIYNHRELRIELEKRGHTFHSDHSDTEVLLNALLEWGADALGRLNGMFAFACVDFRNQELIIARDPMGQKPLYVATPSSFDSQSPFQLAFSSELSSIAALPGATKQISPGGFTRFLAMDYVPDPDCIYEHVYKVPPGCYLKIALDAPVPASAPQFQSYWDIGFGRVALPESPEDCLELIRTTIDEAIKTRLAADVPVGVLLSGGIDSSLVAALAANHTTKLKTFSVAFNDKSYDESSYARMMAKTIGAAHQEEVLDESTLLKVLPDIADHLSEPFADHSVIPTYLLSRFTRQNVTVALGGDGGDELFLGYPTFIAERLLDFVPRIDPLYSRGVQGLQTLARYLPVSHKNISLDFKIKQLLGGMRETDVMRRHQNFLTGIHQGNLVPIVKEEARQWLQTQDLFGLFDNYQAKRESVGARDKWDALAYSYSRTYLAAGVLQKVDRATMAVSLEARAPLLDKRVVDLAMSFSGKQKLRQFKTKSILKDACRPLLPDDIIDRPKKGFGVPVGSWLMGPLKEMMLDLLSPAALRSDPFLNPTAVTQLVDQHLAQTHNHRKILWTLFMYRWWKTRVHDAN